MSKPDYETSFALGHYFLGDCHHAFCPTEAEMYQGDQRLHFHRDQVVETHPERLKVPAFELAFIRRILGINNVESVSCHEGWVEVLSVRPNLWIEREVAQSYKETIAEFLQVEIFEQDEDHRDQPNSIFEGQGKQSLSHFYSNTFCI